MAKRDGIRRTIGLRVRLTLSYVILFTLLILGLGLLFRQILTYQLKQNSSAILEEEWAAVKGYMKVEKNKAIWYFDKDDQEEEFYVKRLRRIFLLTDRNGQVLEVSDLYNTLGVESRAEIQTVLKKRLEEQTRRDSDGVPYLIRRGLLIDDGKKEFMLSIGRSLESEEKVVVQFTRQYFSVIPLLIVFIGGLGWWMAGRALEPVNRVALAAASITGENLSLRIARRGAGDELDHLIESFNNMVDRLENSFNQVRQFSIDVSHELRTPLTAVRGQLEVALFTAKSSEQYREAIMSAIEDVDQLGKIVRALLHLSQAETGQVTLARDPIELDELARRVIEQFQIPAEIEGLQLVSFLEPGTRVLGDRIQIERLLSNLLSNAIKYTGAGGKVTATVRPVADGVELTISDTGRGIPPEHLPHIFDRFYRVPDGGSSPEKGLGLGLSFVAWIAKAHGATIQADSQAGSGSCFTVTFPAETQASSAPEPVGDRIEA